MNMIQKIKGYMLMLSTALLLLLPAAVPLAVASADTVCGTNTIGGAVSKGANGAATGNAVGNCTQSSGVDESSITKIGHDVVNIFSIVVGVISVIMIIVGGFRYITSGGSSEKVGGAKNTIIYAIIGLVIVAIAQVIVHFVLNQTNNAVG